MPWMLRLELSRLMNSSQPAWHEEKRSEGIDIGRSWIKQRSGGVFTL